MLTVGRENKYISFSEIRHECVSCWPVALGAGRRDLLPEHSFLFSLWDTSEVIWWNNLFFANRPLCFLCHHSLEKCLHTTLKYFQLGSTISGNKMNERNVSGEGSIHPAEHQIASECRSKPWATAGGEIARLLPHLSELTSLPGPRPTSFSYRLLLVNLVGSLTSNCHLLFRSPLWSDSSPAIILPLDRLAPSLWWAVWGCLCLSSAQWHRGCFSTLPLTLLWKRNANPCLPWEGNMFRQRSPYMVTKLLEPINELFRVSSDKVTIKINYASMC